MRKFITVEGPDGVGKTTIVSEMVKQFANRGHSVMSVRGFGGTEFSNTFREFLFNRKRKSVPLEVLGIPICFLDVFEEVLQPKVNEDTIVIVDRWFLSYHAYQVGARQDKVAQQILSNILDIDTHSTLHGMEVICLADYDVCEKRLHLRDDSNYLDKEAQVFKEDVHRYFSMASKSRQILTNLREDAVKFIEADPKEVYKDRVQTYTINCNGSMESVFSQISTLVNKYEQTL